MRRALLMLPLLLLATFLLRPAPGSADDLPDAPNMDSSLSVAYYQDAYIRGGGIDGARIEMELTATGTPLTCGNRGTDMELDDGPVFVSGGGFRCSIPGKDFHNPTKAESTTSITVYQVVNDVRSHGKVVNVTFRASRFSLEVEPPESLPVDEPIMFTGIREDGAGFIPIRIEWTLKRNGVSVFPERDTDKRSCDAGEQADNDTFTCYFDSDNPDDMFPPETAESMMVTPATPALFVAPAIQVSPAILPDGNYAISLNEVVGDDVADTINFNFTVGNVNNPSPNAPPGETDELAGPIFETIPLAPLPTPGPEIDDAPDVPDEAPVAAPPSTPVDRDVLRILILAIIAFTVMAVNGARGLGAPRRLLEAPVGAGPIQQDSDVPLTRDATMAVLAGLGGEVLDGSDEDAGRARPFGNAWGDRSVTWRFPGWPGLDRVSRVAPVALAPRLPLVARITADGAYLRAALGVLWSLLPMVGLVLGVVAAFDGGAAPLPPTLGLVAGLLVLAVLDASAGIAAVVAFAAVTLARGGLTAEGLSLDEGIRGLMGLAALWFIAPLVAAAARPLRRVAEPEHVYSWDRFGDTIIAALISGWAVQGIVGALGDLTGRELAITSHADGLALVTIAAVVGRFLLEEAVASLYPRRLRAVQESDTLPDPTQLQQVRGLVFRAGLLAFFAGAFLGNCWQLWAGVVIFSIPQILQLLGSRIPDVRKLVAAVPRGVVRVFVLVVVGTAIAYLVDSRGSDDQLTAIRQGFVLLAIPGAALEILSVFGGETPKIRWTWPKQLAGAGVVAATTALVLLLL